MKIEEVLAEIELRLETAKSDDTKLRKTIPYLFRAVEVLEVVDKQLVSELKAELLELNILFDRQSISNKIDEIKIIISKLKEKLKATETIQSSDTYLVKYYGVKSVERTNNYSKAKNKYKSSLKAIEKCGSDILSAKEYVKNLHEPIKHGKYAGYLHARIDNNLRLMYFIDTNTKILWFDNLITKNELEKA